MSVASRTSVVVATGFGDPPVIEIVEREVPEPGPGQVRVAVRAAGVNPVDLVTARGGLGHDGSALPLPLGWEAAGVVTAVGPDAVSRAGRVLVGDEVIAFPVDGAWAGHLVVPARSVVPKPRSLSFPEAAGLLLAGVAGVHALTAAGIVRDTTVLVHGASGNVGFAAAQVALADGARVIGTAQARHHDRLRALGVQPVAYGDGLLDRVRAVAPHGVDGVVDASGDDEAIDVSLQLVHERRLIVSLAAFHRAAEGITLVGFSPGVAADPGTEIRDAARLRVTALVDDQLLKVVVADTFPLARASDALGRLAAGDVGGKVVLLPQP